MQPCPEALASGAVVLGDSGGIWVEDVVGTGTRGASMHSGAFSTPDVEASEVETETLDDLADVGSFDAPDFEASEVETEKLEDLVDLGGFDLADFEVGAGPCEAGEFACD